MKKKASLAIILILLAAASISAQTDAPSGEQAAQTPAEPGTDGKSFSHDEALSGYSPWSYFGGLNLIVNSNGAGVTFVGINPDGSTGGLSSAPSPIVGYLGVEYRYPIKRDVLIAPSVSFYAVRYLWAEDRALPAEVENRTAFVPTMLIDCPFLYRIDKDRFLFTFGGGPAILLRYGFLESGVSKDEKSYSADMEAGEQVKNINKYLWSGFRWFYPMLEGTARYRLDNGWGAGVTLRIGIPIFNLWTTPKVPMIDSTMFLAAITFTPPAVKKADTEEAADDAELPSVRGQSTSTTP